MRRVVLALLVLVAVSLAGCGNGEEFTPPPPTTPLPRFPTVAQLTKATIDKHRQDQTARFRVTGVASGDNPRNLSGTGSVRFLDTGVALQLALNLQKVGDPPGPEFTLVILPDQIYLKVPDAASPIMPPGKSWFRIEDNSTSPAMMAFYEAAQNLRQNADPTQGFSQLGNAERIVESDQELLDNLWTVRYRIRLDFQAAAALSPDPGTQQALQALVEAGAPSDDTQLWLDAQNRVLRMVLSRSYLTSTGTVTTYSLTTRYFGWSEPVEINPPPPDLVAN